MGGTTRHTFNDLLFSTICMSLKDLIFFIDFRMEINLLLLRELSFFFIFQFEFLSWRRDFSYRIFVFWYEIRFSLTHQQMIHLIMFEILFNNFFFNFNDFWAYFDFQGRKPEVPALETIERVVPGWMDYALVLLLVIPIKISEKWLKKQQKKNYPFAAFAYWRYSTPDSQQ